jgi:hypothetical protein
MLLLRYIRVVPTHLATIGNRMKFTLGQAAQEAGRNKSTLSRDIAKGRLSAERQVDGSYLIDPSELYRVYPKSPHNNGMATVANATVEAGAQAQLQLLQAQLDAALQRVADKERHLQDKESQLSDLQKDRDHWRQHAERSSLMIEDMRKKEEAVKAEPPKKRSWFK